MTSAMFILSLFSVIPLITFALCFLYFAAESIPREGYAPDPDDGLLKSVVSKILVAELVAFILTIPLALNPPAESNLNFVDAGHADMTSYWVAVVIIMLLTPVLVPLSIGVCIGFWRVFVGSLRLSMSSLRGLSNGGVRLSLRIGVSPAVPTCERHK